MGNLPVIKNNTEKRKPRHPRKNGKWYSDGLKFRCKKCAACCSGEPGFVWITLEDIDKIAAHLKITVEDMKKQYIRPAGTGFSLIERPNGDCVFLNNKKCAIYPVRPVQCTTWPFWEANLVSRESWNRYCNACPGGGLGRHYKFSSIERALLRNKRYK